MRFHSATIVRLSVGLLLALFAGSVQAYDRYSINDDATNCHFCHGDFRANGYVGKTDGQTWGNLHNIHRSTMLGGDCETCHQAGTDFPVLLNSSGGGDGLAAISCIGCHGRAEDGTGQGTEGYGLAIQRRHEAANVGGDQNGDTCFTCHTDAATRTPVGEHVLPVYYANPGNGHTNMPDDPCNPLPDLTEDFAGLTTGIDNDGDLVTDQDDPDCSTATASPGEVAGDGLQMLLVTSHEPTTRQMGISYGKACTATDNTIEYGPLAQVSTYGYSGQQCSLGDVDNVLWTYPLAPDSLFFVVVGNDGSNEGSYGLDGISGGERPADLLNGACPLPQDLATRCDP